MMKQLILSICTVALLAGCTGGWNNDNKEAYLQACADSPNASGLDETQRKNYCDCSLTEVMKHYDTIEEVIANKDSTAINEVMLQCRANSLK